MNNQQLRSIPSQYKLLVGLALLALFLLASLVIGLFVLHGDFLLIYRNILASIAILVGLLGLFVYLARQFGWALPSFLQVPEERRDQNWRLLAMSLAAIAFPVLMIITQQLLFH
jgi:hypothetical protein